MILLSAGIGATPVLAMLHALAAGVSRREIWWVHGARNSGEHAFASEVQALLKLLPGGHSHIRYSAPRPRGPAGGRFRRRRALKRSRPAGAGRASRGGFLSVRTGRIYEQSDRRSGELGCLSGAAAQREFRLWSGADPGCRRRSTTDAASAGSACRRRADGVLSREAIWPCAGIRRFRAYSNWPRPAMCRCGGRVAPASATIARPDLSPAQSTISLTRSSRRRTAIY